MTNSINQPWTPATAPRNTSRELIASKPYNAKAESPEAMADDQSIKNEALPKQSPGSTSAKPVGSTSPGVGTPTAVPGGAVPTTPGV